MKTLSERPLSDRRFGGCARHSAWSAVALLASSAVLSLILAARPFGIDRDFIEYKTFYDAGDGASRMVQSGIGLLWRNLASFGLSFYEALTVTTFLALTPKLLVLARGRYWIESLIAYFLIFLPVLECTQIRLALSLGLALPAIQMTVLNGRATSSALILGALSCWIHTSALAVVLPLLLWERASRYPTISCGAAILLSIMLATTELEWLVTALHPQGQSLLPTADSTTFNPIAIRTLSVLLLTAIALANLYRVPGSFRPLPIITLCCCCFAISAPSAPVVAGRVFELGMLMPLLWIPALPNRSRKASYAIYFSLGLLVSYLTLTDPTFFRQTQ